MESSDSREPSYYEVALTNRQVLVAFVALLSCLLAAFFSGVWLGRGGSVAQPASPQLAQRATPEPQLEQLTFFSGKEPGARATSTPPPVATPTATAPPAATPAPEPEVVVAAPGTDDPEGESLRRNLEGAIEAGRIDPPTPTPVPGPSPTARPAATAAARIAEPSQPAGRFFVQVYSSTNGVRAREIVADLRKAGFQVVLSEPSPGATANFRVRVGPFENRDRAETAAKRLQREHRLDYWITDTP